MFVQLTTCFVLINSKYINQGLNLDHFDITKSGNLFTFLFFGLISALTFVNLFFSKKLRHSSVLILLITSLIGLIMVLFVNYVSMKGEKVIFSSLYIFLALFALYSLLTLLFSRSKKIHLFSNVVSTLFVFLFITIIIFLQIYNFKDDTDIFSNGLQDPADAGIIFGAAVWGGNRPSPVLRERINKGYEIFKKGLIRNIVLTGGGSPNELTEADVARNELIKYGIPKDLLIVENTSSSTMEQLLFVRDNLYIVNNWKKIILISDFYHLYRITEICKFNNMNSDAISSDTPLSPNAGILFSFKETFAVLMFWVFGYG
ncbi:MAG: hypothetical protein EDM69_02115 [Chlorobiota bacterium]|nr:MAG: hypothetical protein EDM69_02115 [Chlorobiota bacterium]MBV6398057.1 hypothetical protein [Ignavibacteria bacterium]MCE7952418.1 hypothetical protein [Chlorobi bacterium CHB7]RIK48985.1 MAG: hypothetical protein DCC60_05245 [Ignavibacteriota bacterium]